MFEQTITWLANPHHVFFLSVFAVIIIATALDIAFTKEA